MMNIGNINFNFPTALTVGVEPNNSETSKVSEHAHVASKGADKISTPSDSFTSSRSAAPAKTEDAPDSFKATEAKSPEIVVMREKGLETLVKEIDNAKKSIDLHIYIITANTPELMAAFHRALERGVKVRLMVEDDPFYWTQTHSNPSEQAIKELVAAGAEYKPDNPVFSKSRVTHEKSMVFDGKRAMILTGNLGSSTFKKNLDLGAILIDNPKVAKQVETIFNSDWERTPLPDMGDTDLVISPDNARPQLTNLFNSAKSSIQVLQQGFTDRATIDLLAKKLDEGVKTELTLTDPGIAQGNMQNAAYLALKGADVNFLITPYIHAKAVEIDGGKTDSKTYIGSQNFSMSAIDKNRELGYIFHDDKEQLPSIISKYRKQGFAIPSKMVITDPSAIGSAVKGAIRTAEEKIVVQTNLFSDTATMKALMKAAKNGCKVTVMMPQNPFPWDPSFTGNKDMAKQLTDAGVEVKFSDNTFKGMQGTCVLVDGKESITYPDNLSSSAFKYNNSYGVINIAPKDVAEVEQLLNGDMEAMSKISSSDLNPTSEVVVSPGNARQQLKSLISSADKSLLISTKDISDREIIDMLKAKAKKGVSIHLLIGKDPAKPALKKVIDELTAAGVKVQNMVLDKLNNNYIEVDHEKAFVGSQALTQDSIDNQHGYGNMLSHEEMLRIGRGTFAAQWQKAGVEAGQKQIEVTAKSIDSDRDLQDLLSACGKRGVRVTVNCENYDKSVIKAQFETLNAELVKMASLDPAIPENKDTLAQFFGFYFDTDRAIEAQKHLQEALAALKPGEELFSGKTVSNFSDKSKSMKISVDGKPLELLPSRADEIATMKK